MPINPARPFAGLELVDFTGLRMRLIDADRQVVGRLATFLSVLLQGKDKPTYAPNRDCGDVCIVVNAERAVLTGNKWEGKLYRWHTGHPGGLKQISAKELWRRDPGEVLRRAVYGMLPKNNLRDARMRKLRVFPGPTHPFKGVELVPWAPPPRRLQDKGLGWLPPQGFEPMNPEAYLTRMRGSRLLVQQPAAAAAAAQQQPAALAQPGDSSGGGQAAAPPQEGSGSSLAGVPRPVVGFEDLLSAEELAFIRSRMQQQ